MQNAAIIGIILILVGVLLWRLRRSDGDESIQKRRIGDGLRHLQTQMDQYREMSREKLDQVADDALLEAVLANLWAKMAPGLSDAAEVMTLQSRPRQLLYAVYSVYGELREAKARPADMDDAIECLQYLGADQSASVLREAASSSTEVSMLAAPFQECFEAEQVKQRLVRYIREQADAFCDADV